MSILFPKSLLLIIVLAGGVLATQYIYDREKLAHPKIQFPRSLELIKVFDFGLHNAVASFLWIETMKKTPFVSDKDKTFFDELEIINNLDPRFSFPYAYSVLVLPFARNLSDRIEAAIKIGERGVQSADPDWRIPFYLAVAYHLYKGDAQNATRYFDLASRTKDAPLEIQRFGKNYPLLRGAREQSKAIWTTLLENAEDEETRKRARTYLERIELFDLLTQAARLYREQKGEYPREIMDLVNEKIIPEMPRDPFGFEFSFDATGRLRVKE